MSLYRQGLLITFAVIGVFLVAGILGSITGAHPAGPWAHPAGPSWDWLDSGSFYATFAAVQVAYFAASRHRFLLAFCVLVLGAIASWLIAESLAHLFWWYRAISNQST